MSLDRTLIALIGPTATGKSQLALELYNKYPVEIVSVDSAMIYRGLNIGTDKPDNKILSNIKHHLINIRDPYETYNIGDFFSDIKSVLSTIHSKKKIPLLVGGSLMYFNQLFTGISSLPEKSISDRKLINTLLENYDCNELHSCLQNIDIESFKRIDKNDRQRIERALEVYMITGMPMSKLLNQKTNILENYNILLIKLFSNDRSIIHQKIEKRVDKMLANGLVDEVKALIDKFSLNDQMQSMKCIGYRHVFEYLSQKQKSEELRDKCIFSTRQLAKRQITWLKQFNHGYPVDISTNTLQKSCKFIDKNLHFI